MMQSLLLASLAAGALPAASATKLYFNDDGNFQISIFSDMHFGESTFKLYFIYVQYICI
jgi:hypothetical protein